MVYKCAKRCGDSSKDILETTDKNTRRFLRIYREYETLCERNGVVDFAELLLRAYELIRDDERLRYQYQERFSQIHVDEFQDTNTIQYAWLTLLSPNRDNMFVVGDDDQAIYGWRGAKIENIYKFQREYPQHQIIKLEQNYRSTGSILKAANQIITNNTGRMGKSLWTEMADGEKSRFMRLTMKLTKRIMLLNESKTGLVKEINVLIVRFCTVQMRNRDNLKKS